MHPAQVIADEYEKIDKELLEFVEDVLLNRCENSTERMLEYAATLEPKCKPTDVKKKGQGAGAAEGGKKQVGGGGGRLAGVGVGVRLAGSLGGLERAGCGLLLLCWLGRACGLGLCSWVGARMGPACRAPGQAGKAASPLTPPADSSSPPGPPLGL